MDLSPQAFLMNTSTRHTEWKVIIAKSFPKDNDYDLVSFFYGSFFYSKWL